MKFNHIATLLTIAFIIIMTIIYSNLGVIPTAVFVSGVWAIVILNFMPPIHRQ